SLSRFQGTAVYDLRDTFFIADFRDLEIDLTIIDKYEVADSYVAWQVGIRRTHDLAVAKELTGSDDKRLPALEYGTGFNFLNSDLRTLQVLQQGYGCAEFLVEFTHVIDYLLVVFMRTV